MKDFGFATSFVSTRWGKMCVRVAGAGEAIVCVHGLGVSGSYFTAAGAQLASSYRVYIPDLPGSGRSAKPWHVLDCMELAEVLIQWYESTGLGAALWIGNSVGCQVVVNIAIMRPDLVRALVLEGPPMDPETSGMVQQAARLAMDATRERASEVFLALADYARFGLLRFVHTFLHARADRIETKVARVTSPTLIMRGKRDPIVSHHWAQRLASLLPDGRLLTFPAAAHTVHYSLPQEFAEAVRAFDLNITAVRENDSQGYRTG